MNLRKVAIVGCGMVGSSTAFSLIKSGLFTDIMLIDVNHERAVGEAMDLSHCLPFMPTVEIYAAGYSDLTDCGIIIITAGVAQKPGETRRDCIHNNIKVLRSVIGEINKFNRDGHLLVVSNPVDALAYAAYKLSERAPNKVFGSGTVLDTARLKFSVGRQLNVDSRSVHAFIIGEHGDSELAVWSSANISGIPLDEYCTRYGSAKRVCDKQNLLSVVQNSAYEIIARKGATYYGIAAAVTRICESVVRDEHTVMPVSTLINGHYGLDDVFISVPALIGADGVEDIIDVKLSRQEQNALSASAETLKADLKEIGFV